MGGSWAGVHVLSQKTHTAVGLFRMSVCGQGTRDPRRPQVTGFTPDLVSQAAWGA